MAGVISPWPSFKYEHDIVGPMLQGMDQKNFLLVSMDYFTKKIETKSLGRIRKKEIIWFIWKNITILFNFLGEFVIDNGKQFVGHNIKNFTSSKWLRKIFKQVDVRIIDKEVETSKGKWVQELPGILQAIRTSPWETTNKTPLSLVYKIKDGSSNRSKGAQDEVKLN